MTVRTHGSAQDAAIRGQVAAEVRAQAARANVKYGDLADILGLSPSSMSSRMTGQQSFRESELVLVARRLGCDVAEFFATVRQPPLSGRKPGHRFHQDVYAVAA